MLHLRKLTQPGVGLQPLVDVEDRLLDRVDLRLRIVAPLDERQPRRRRLLVALDGFVVDARLLVDLLLQLVELGLLPLLFLVVALVARLAQLVVDRVLPRLDEAEVELALRFLDARVVVGLDGSVVLAPLLLVSRDRVGRGLQFRFQFIKLLLAFRRIEALLGAVAIGAQVRLFEAEKLSLVILPRPSRHDLVVDRPCRRQRDQHGQADEGPLHALQLERSSRHVVRCSKCSG